VRLLDVVVIVSPESQAAGGGPQIEHHFSQLVERNPFVEQLRRAGALPLKLSMIGHFWACGLPGIGY